jgi:3-mercaptopropionate dioxygenase
MPLLSPPRSTAPGLDDLVVAIRAVVGRHDDWQRTARLAAQALRGHLPSPDVVMGGQPAPEDLRTRLLHIEPDGAFSILAVVWHPGQTTSIHDHVTWCVFGGIQGIEHEELFTLDDRGEYLIPAGRNTNVAGEVSGFAPPGDIHRVRNPDRHTAISIHIYGTDLSRVGSSVRRRYDLPVRPA